MIIYPGRTIRQRTRRISGFPGISWKQYFGERIYPVPPGTSQNRQLDTVTGSLYRISGIFPGVPEGFPGKSLNTASGIIVLGKMKEMVRCPLLNDE